MTRRRALLAGAAVLLAAARRDGEPPSHRAVRLVADGRLRVATADGAGLLPLYVSADWSAPLPGITRAVIVVHGQLRNAATYYRSAQQAAAAAGPAAAGSLLVVPQFLAEVDAGANGLPAEVLRWRGGGWMGGEPASGPAPVSSFDALDAIVARLGDRSLLPNLRLVVVAGHSGGGQVVQRYAVLGRGAAGVPVRFVVANPSSYAYFSAERPAAPPGFSPAQCPDFDTWKYGMHGLPRYAGAADAAAVERGYAARQVTYLLGGADTDPDQAALDRSCAGEAQGPYRLARGQAYYAYLRARHPQMGQSVVIVPGVGHNGRAMFTSPQGVAALFG